jgi:hypothetical protein
LLMLKVLCGISIDPFLQAYSLLYSSIVYSIGQFLGNRVPILLSFDDIL